MSLAETLGKLVEGKHLEMDEAREAMAAIMDGQVSDAQTAAFLVALRMKGETGDEVAGFSAAMRARVTRVWPKRTDLVDTCGTGGDTYKTYNISTAAAFIAAAAGAAVAKHGNRASSGICGSADVLETLGVKLDLSPELAARAIDELGIAFLFAPAYHPAMVHAGPVRKDLKLRTVFNILGPLTNPAGADFQVIGVYSPAVVPLIAAALLKLGCVRGVVAHGEPGIDEVSALGRTQYALISDGRISYGEWLPEDFGLEPVDPSAVKAGADKAAHAEMLTEALSKPDSPLCTAALPTAGCALWAAGRTTIPDGVQRAREAVASGAALARLKDYARFSNECA